MASVHKTITSTGAFNNLTVNKTAGIINLGSNVTVNSTLNFILNKINTGSIIRPDPTYHGHRNRCCSVDRLGDRKATKSAAYR